MLTELMGEDRGIKPIEAKVAPIDHIHQRIQHVVFLSDFVSEAEMVLPFHETQHSFFRHFFLLHQAAASFSVCSLICRSTSPINEL